MTQNANATNASTNLLDKVVNIDPVGVIYNMTGDMVEDFVEQYLYSKGVDGVSAVKVHVKNEGRNNPYIAVYLFMNKDSKFIVSEIQSIPKVLRDKIDKVNISMSDDFKKIIAPLAGNDIESGRAEGNDYFVKLNIFRVIGMMLAVDRRKHSLTIMDAKKFPKGGNSLFSVMKGVQYTYGGSNNGDKYTRQINNLERKFDR